MRKPCQPAFKEGWPDPKTYRYYVLLVPYDDDGSITSITRADVRGIALKPFTRTHDGWVRHYLVNQEDVTLLLLAGWEPYQNDGYVRLKAPKGYHHGEKRPSR
jgi:hypothetical protein